MQADSTALDDAIAIAVAGVVAQRDAFTEQLLGLFAAEIAPLQHDDELLGLLAASTEENVVTALHLLQHGLDAQTIDPPAAALQYARRLAQRSVPLSALLRSYRLGHARFLEALLQALSGAKGIEPALSGAAGVRLSQLTTRYIDRVVELIVVAYETEREAWLNNRSAVRAARVAAVLADPALDVPSTERSLGYRLGATHVAIHLWAAQAAPGDDVLLHLERLAHVLASACGAGRPLVVPGDEASAVMWMPVDAAPVDGHVLRAALSGSPPAVRIAVGEPAAGVAGFRSTHRQASQAKAVAVAAGPDARRVTLFRDAGVVAMLCSDLAGTRAWVCDVLGGLARDDDGTRVLRETLHAFLRAGGSCSRAAAVLSLHRNSVQYRVQKAERLRGRGAREDSADLELALRTCELLGRRVLSPG